MAKLTKRTVEAASAGPRDTYLWDDAIKGFCVKVTPAGRRVYLLQYRVGGREARTRRFTIGAHGSPWTAEQARAEAERLAIMASRGEDPMLVEARRRSEAVSLEVASYIDTFVERYLKANWKASWNDGKRVLEMHVVPYWKGHALPNMTRRDVSMVLDRLADRPAMAKLTFATLRKLFRWAVERGDLAISPMSDMTGPRPVAARDRVLSDEELAAVWESAGTLGFPFGPMTRLLIATGARREEAAALDWAELDTEAHKWTLPGARAKNDVAHVIPLNDLAMSTLATLRLSRCGLAFSTTGKTPPSGFSKAKARLDVATLDRLRERAGERGEGQLSKIDLSPFRIHDLRRTVATGLQRLGVRFEVTEAVLNHVSGAKSGVAGVYQRHHWTDEKRAALEAWGRHVTAALPVAKPDHSNVVAMPDRHVA